MNILQKIKFKFSPEFCINHGRKLWEKLDKELPKATATQIEYEDRLKMFGEKTFQLTPNDIKGLKMYLEYCLEQIEIWRDEFQSSREEEAEARQKQIIKDHLRVLCPKIDPPINFG